MPVALSGAKLSAMRPKKPLSYAWYRLEGLAYVLIVAPFVLLILALVGWLPQMNLPVDFFLILPYTALGLLIVWYIRRRFG